MFKYFLLIFGLLLFERGLTITTELCTPTAIVFRGTDYVKTAKGQLVLVAFMPLQCPRCRQQLERLSSSAASLHGVRVAVLAPHWENYAVIGKIQTEFPRILIDKDVDSTYDRLGVQEHEVAIFDKCGRLAHVISASRSDISKFEDTIDALKSAQSHAICGWCSYGNTPSNPRKPEEKKVDVWLKAHTSADNQRIRKEDEMRRRSQGGVNQGSQSIYGQHRASPTTNYQQKPPYNYQQQEQRQNLNQPTKQSLQTPLNYRGTGVLGQDQRNSENQQRIPEPQTPKIEKSFLNSAAIPTKSLKPSSTAKTTTTQQSKFVEADYDYYLGATTGDGSTTEAPVQTQIPRPSLQPWWSVPPPTISIQQQVLLGEENIPCTAYTDDVCYHQQEKVGVAHISKCCSKRIYFTDLCVPGKCSNSTIQLCCMQKFLQSRYGCCHDESQSDGETPTDKFSRCCHDSFTVEDDCCPMAAAKTYWESAHELCFPNTKIHLEKIKMEVRFSEGVRVIDLSENRLWDHECPFGTNRQQYAYVP